MNMSPPDACGSVARAMQLAREQMKRELMKALFIPAGMCVVLAFSLLVLAQHPLIRKVLEHALAGLNCI
jgi:hypothetical protein